MTAPQRFGNKNYEDVMRFNELCGSNPVWLGPRGRDYGAMLPHPKPYQIANLYPDPNSSYWIAQLHLPAGATVLFKGHCRYTEFALYRPDPLGSFTATDEALTDEVSVNPFVPGNPRLSESHDYTIRIVAKDAPARKGMAVRTVLYSLGVVVVLALETGFEGKSEHGGFVVALQAAFDGGNAFHFYTNAICITGALLVYNIFSVIRSYHGSRGLLKMFLQPLPPSE